MSLRLTLFLRLPGRLVRCRLLERLAAATAAGFGVSYQTDPRSPFTQRLAHYAQFTAAEASRVAQLKVAPAESAAPAARPLYVNAQTLGSELRRWLGVRHPDESLALLRFLYRQIGILTVEPPQRRSEATDSTQPWTADIEITKCFFADYYCATTCHLMSAVDEGIAAGLFGGATLTFCQRLTENGCCCRAIIRTLEDQS